MPVGGRRLADEIGLLPFLLTAAQKGRYWQSRRGDGGELRDRPRLIGVGAGEQHLQAPKLWRGALCDQRSIRLIGMHGLGGEDGMTVSLVPTSSSTARRQLTCGSCAISLRRPVYEPAAHRVDGFRPTAGPEPSTCYG